MANLASTGSVNSVVQRARAVLAPLADVRRAAAMRAYLRDQFEFLGIPAPERRAAVTPMLRSLRGASADELMSYAKEFWRQPQREFQYVAIVLLARQTKTLAGPLCAGRAGALARQRLRGLLQLAQLDSWWDTVDGLAGIVGDLVLARRAVDRLCQEEMDIALHHENLWVRRIAMLHQLGWREQTDAVRLFGYADALALEENFFVRKAIGWALRDFARHDPVAVRRYLRQKEGLLAPLSWREAARHLDMRGK